MTITTLSDFNGDGQVHNACDLFQLPAQTMALALSIREISGGPSASRVGGFDVASHNGTPLVVNELFSFHFWGRYFPLNSIFIYTAAADTLAISVIL